MSELREYLLGEACNWVYVWKESRNALKSDDQHASNRTAKLWSDGKLDISSRFLVVPVS
jgi:hypothetical protein